MAAQAFLAIVLDLFLLGDQTMRVMARGASHLASAGKIAAAQLQREIVLQKI